ncbi:LysE family translocator [Polaromonas sp. UC242_47]|uniref:LysE family translocator n=1 Tax=Polaromonas sp. UC242_47 TaxID=3374626 RepID=UPI00378B401C
MTASAWLLFITISLVTAFSPGPGILLAVSNAVAWGPRKTLCSSAGNVLGVFAVSGAAMAGLGTLLHSSAWLFAVLKTLGALYLIYLGYRQWTSQTSMFDKPLPTEAQTEKTNAVLFRQGLLVALTNPKSILFFTALFPQFIHAQAPMLPQFLALTSAFAACVLSSHMAYVLLARHTHRWLGTPQRARVFNRVCGGAFGLLGLSLLRLKSPH